MAYYQYPNNYCPFCYTQLPKPTLYSCRLCDNQTQKEGEFNADDSGIPICSCGGGKMIIRCGKCSRIIPTKKTKTVFIGGMRSSGKTTYLIDILDSKSSKTGLLMVPEDKKTIAVREKGAINVKAGNEEQSTRPGYNDESIVVSITPINGPMRLISDGVCLSLTNRAGEESVELDTLLTREYVNYADYIILLLDVLNLPGIMQSLKEKNIKTVQGETETIENLVSAQSIVKAFEQARGKACKKIPVLVGLSKWDYIEKAGLCPPGFSIGCYGEDFSAVYKNGKFDSKQFSRNSDQLRQFLIEHDEAEFVNTLENRFKGLFKSNVSYFAFSSFGTAPTIDENGQVDRPVHQKCHIMDPFYFILRDSKVM